jgi:hypothetical protein
MGVEIVILDRRLSQARSCGACSCGCSKSQQFTLRRQRMLFLNTPLTDFRAGQTRQLRERKGRSNTKNTLWTPAEMECSLTPLRVGDAWTEYPAPSVFTSEERLSRASVLTADRLACVALSTAAGLADASV